MPLSAVNFVPLTGNIKAADLRSFFDLFTGAMTDQPVTFANTLQVGGSQGAGVPPIRIVGVAAQTANMVEARALAADVQPIFSVGPTGTISWGPGGAVGPDVTLARSAANQLTLTGLAGTPALVIPVGGLRVSAGNVGIGSAPAANVALTVTGTISTSGAVAYGLWIPATLVAQVNGDTLAGVSISPTFNDNAKTGVTHLGLDIATGGLRVTAGNAGIGINPSGFIGLTVVPTLTGTSQWGINSQPTGSTASVNDVTGFISQPGTAAGLATNFVAGYRAVSPAKGAGSTIVSAYGMLVDALTAGNTNNYGVYIGIPTGATGDNYSLVTLGAALLGSSPPGPTFTTGHAYLPLVGGAPSGVPADGSPGNRAPIVIDNVNNKIWTRIGGTWKGVTVA